MTDLAVIGLTLRTDEVERGEKVVVKAFGNMAAAREKESVAARIATQAERQAVQAVEQAARAYSSAGVSSLEFTRALKQMGAVGPAVTEEINRHSAAARANAQAAKLAADAQRQTAEAVKTADVATTRATPGLKSLQTNLGSLAIAAGGLPGPLGRTAQALSTFALGGGPAVAIIAGISAIAYAYNEIEAPARRAREETDKLIASLREAERARLGLDRADAGADLSKRLAAAQANLNRQQAGITRRGNDGFGGFVEISPERIAAAKAEVAKVVDEIRLLQGLNASIALEAGKKVLAAQAEAARQAAAAAKARGADLATLRTAELELAVFQAEKNRDTLAFYDAKRALAEQGLAKELAGVATLSAAQKKAFEDAKRQQDELYLAPGGLSNRFRDILQNGTGLTPTVGYSDDTRSNIVASDSRRRLANVPLLTPDAIGKTGKEVETRLSAAMDEAARNFQRGMTSAIEGLITGAPDLGRQLGQALASGAAGIISAGITDSLSKAFKALPAETQERLKGIAGVAGAGVVGASVGYSTGSTGLGALSGAATGAAVAGPLGAVVGGIAGIVGGLLGSSQQAKEAARQMEEARKAFGLALDAYTAEAFGTATNLSRNIANANRLGDDLKRNAPKPVLASADADDVRRFQRELADYAAALGKVDEATKATIASIEAEEKVRLELIGLSLEEREARLAGNDRGALEARFAREEAEVQRQLRNGEITQAIATRTSAVITGELNKALADMAKEAEEAAKQIAETNASFATSLVGRELQARARLATSDAEREGIEDMIRAEQYRLEIEAAVKDGISETNIAALKRIQGLEEEAIAMERSKKAEEDRLRIIKESTAFLDDLKVREFRATGQGAAADEYAQRERDRQELIKAAEFGADYVMETLRVQGLERADRDAQRRAQQEAAFGNSFGTTSTSLLPDSRTSVNLAVGTSESTTNRLVGVLQSQLVHAQQTAANTRESAELLRTLPHILAALRGGVVSVVDEGLAVAGADADLGAGVVPGNR
ncbi:MAG: hypothetical protein SFU57_00230 [Gemmatimonadales bacterium]|nr:hypothetical protein [Gemmatimonadales bacterium]